MLELFEEVLQEVDNRLPLTDSGDIPALFEAVPLSVFGQLLLHTPSRFPNIRKFLPTMASEATQQHWTGASGNELLGQSTAFMASLANGFTAIARQDLSTCSVLDFGCGWGRLTRYLYKLVPVENIYAIDPFDRAIEECQKCGIVNNLHQSDWVPETLPVEEKFDLIFAFSVFTHLSEKTFRKTLDTLRDYLAPGGVLVITIRPKEYWNYLDDAQQAAEMRSLHESTGFAFTPHDLEPVDGDITYGDTSVRLGYFEKNVPNWSISRIDYNTIDPLQIILFLEPG